MGWDPNKKLKQKETPYLPPSSNYGGAGSDSLKIPNHVRLHAQDRSRWAPAPKGSLNMKSMSGTKPEIYYRRGRPAAAFARDPLPSRRGHPYLKSR